MLLSLFLASQSAFPSADSMKIKSLNYRTKINVIRTALYSQMNSNAENDGSSKVVNLGNNVRVEINSELPVDSSGLPSTVAYPNFDFKVLKTSSTSSARLTKINTPHGDIETPSFVFCATKAAMKSVYPQQMRDEKTQVILSNTYHLMLQPGSEIIEKMGGLQKFTGWGGPMLTDSGGYQIFSMGFGSVSNEIKGKRNITNWETSLLSINENAATFRSYVDGTIRTLTPELSIDIQRQLGADLIVVLDECTPFNVDKEYTKQSMRRSHRWGIRCMNEFLRTASGKQALYGIIQGGVYEDLRRESVDFTNSMPYFGTCIGGSLGATKKDMHDIVKFTRQHVRNDRPVHLLGIGGVRDIFHGVRCGIDTFDCVHPSRLARHGGALVAAHFWDEEEWPDDTLPLVIRSAQEKLRLAHERNIRDYERRKELAELNGLPVPPIPPRLLNPKKLKFQLVNKSKKAQVREHISLTKARMRNDARPIDSTCSCYTCRNFSRAYLHHLFKAQESLGGTLVTIHNVAFMNQLMQQIREGIANDKLDDVEHFFVHQQLRESVYEESVNSDDNT